MLYHTSNQTFDTRMTHARQRLTLASTGSPQDGFPLSDDRSVQPMAIFKRPATAFNLQARGQ